MQVVKVLNNSLVLAIDNEGRENILMGKGIGYNKSIGIMLKPEEVEKVFVLNDKDLSKNIIRLAAEVDEQFFVIAKTIIDYGINQYGMKVMNHIYLSLTDHLSFVAKRVQNGIVFHNFYTLEMKKFNPAEYEVGLFAIQLMYEKTGIQLPKDEAGSIAFHFINAQIGSAYEKNQIEVMKTVAAILEIVKYHFGFSFREDSFEYTRFVTHLRLFVQRLLGDEQIIEQDDFLFQQIAQICKEESDCVGKIDIYLKNTLGKKITFQERIYLIIHLHRILAGQRMDKKEG